MDDALQPAPAAIRPGRRRGAHGRERGPRRRARRVLFPLGVAVIVAGVVVLGFVPYALYATNAAALHAQATLNRAIARTVTRTVEVPASVVRRSTTIPRVSWPATIALGTPIARLSIPAAGVRNDVVVEGVDELRLEEGPGHYPGSALPGQPGNLAIAGHRTTWLHPFYNLQAVRPGDPIVVTFGGERWVYTAQWIKPVSPSDVAVVAPTAGWDLTLTTCNPRFSAAQRLIVRARLDVAATLDSVVPAHHEVVQRVVVTHISTHPTPLPRVPLTVLVAWALGMAVLTASALVLARRHRLTLLLLLPAALCCFEGYGAAARLLPSTW